MRLQMNKEKVGMQTKRIAECLLLAFVLVITTIDANVQVVKAQEYPREQTVICGMGMDIPDLGSFNWLKPGAFYHYFGGLGGLCMEELFYLNIYTGEWIPWLATGYEYSEGYTKLTVTLREGVKWNDGEPFTADDAVFTYELFLESPEMLTPSPMVRENIKSVRKIDDYTFELELTKTNPRLQHSMYVFPASGGGVFGYIHILPKHIWEPYFDNPAACKFYPPVGTGPYRLVLQERTRVVWERRDDWWGTGLWGVRPSARYVIFMTQGPEDVTAMQFANNEMDINGWATPGSGTAASVVLENPYVRGWIDQYPYTWLDVGVRMMRLNWLRYPWNIPEARRGLSYLVNRDEAVGIALEGASYPSLWFTNGSIMMKYYDAIEDLMEEYEPLAYDPEKAYAIFEGLGWTRGADGFWVTDNGTRVKCELIAWAEHLPDVKIGTVVTKNLLAGGIDSSLKPLMPGTAEQLTGSGDFDACIHLSINTIDPLPGLEDLVTTFYNPEGVYIAQNRERYYNEAFDDLVAELKSLSPEEQWDEVEATFHDMMEIILQDTTVVPLCQYPLVILFDTYYWVNWPTEENPYASAADWWTSFIFCMTGYESPITGEWVTGLRPRAYENETVQFTQDVSEWRGIDGTWFGPFSSGDTAVVPLDDAEWLVRNEWATIGEVGPPGPTPIDWTPYVIGAVVVAIVVIAIVIAVRSRKVSA